MPIIGQRLRLTLLGLLVAALAMTVSVLIYWSGLHGGFFFDDGANIIYAENIRMERISLESIQKALTSEHSGHSDRQVAKLSFALNYYFSGLSPFAFKLTNLVIHLANSLLVFLLALRLLNKSVSSPTKKLLTISAGIVAFAWLLHPIQLLPVLYVVQRMTSLSALFLLAALLLHISAREQHPRVNSIRLILAWCLFWPLSYFCKESGALFPLFALAWELIIRRNFTGSLDRFARLFSMVAALSLLTALVYALSPHGQWLWSGYEFRAFTLYERLITEARVLWFYLGLIVFPRLAILGLQHDDLMISSSLVTPWTTLPALAGLFGLVWLAWITRMRTPLVAFGIAWFLIGHGMESTALPLEIAHEHRNYVPLFGILLAGVWCLIQALQYGGLYKTIGIALSSLIIANFVFTTALRSQQFGEEVRQTQIEAQHHPNSARAQYEAGRSLAGLSESRVAHSLTHNTARAYYEKSNTLDLNSKMGWLGLIHLNCNAGIPAEQAWVDELSQRLRNTPYAPGDSVMMNNLKEMSIDGSICLTRADVDSVFSAALNNPRLSAGTKATLNSWHADYFWLREHDLAAARQALGRSLRLNPHNPSNRLKWAQLVLISGDREESRKLLLELLNERFSTEERKTLEGLLSSMKGSVP